MRTEVVIAGGGTAGHVLPALAVAEALVAAGHDRAAVRFAGARRGMEATLVPEAGFPLTLLDVVGLPRRPSLAALRALLALAAATTHALLALRRWRPGVVVSVGGYASVPWAIASVPLRVPLVVVSYDAVPGLANRLASRLARATAVAFAPSSLPRAEVTGTPLRAEVLAVERTRDQAEARRRLGLPADRFVVLVVGGSLGSGALNALVTALVAGHRDRADLALRHLIGARNDDGSITGSDDPAGLIHQVVGYEGHMDLAYAAADLAVARAGSTVVAELAAVGLPSILVPWPQATEDHQSANADVLARVGAAVVLREADLTADALLAEIDRLRAQPARLDAMGRAARSVARPDAAARIAAIADREALR